MIREQAPGAFGAAVPAISGRWINKQNGSVIEIVNNVVNENNEMVLITSDGRSFIMDDEFSNNYVQLNPEDGENYDAIERQFVGQLKNNATRESAFTVDPPVAPRPDVVFEEPGNITFQKESEKSTILDKILKDIPPFAVKIDMSRMNLPKDALKVAVEYLDVTPEDIANYLIKKIKIDETELKEELLKYIN